MWLKGNPDIMQAVEAKILAAAGVIIRANNQGNSPTI
jgi:hypothetical protein